MTQVLLRILSIDHIRAQRLTMAHCELLDGNAKVGEALRTPTWRLVCPISCSYSSGGSDDRLISLAFPDSVASLELCPGDILRTLS